VKILFISVHPPFGGGSAFSSRELADGLRDVGHEVVFLAPHGTRPVEPGTVTWVPAPVPSELMVAPDAIEALDIHVEAVYRTQGPFDAVILGRESFLWQMPTIRRLHGGKPVLLICRGAYINRLAASEPIDAADQARLIDCYRSCDRVICIARHLVGSIERVVGHPRTLFLPNPIALPVFDPDILHRPAPGDPIRLVMAAQIKERKRPLDAVDIVRTLVGRGLDVRLTICGEGSDMPALTERVERHGLGQRITIRQRVGRAEVLEHLGRAETVLLCSDNEGRPRVLQEAIAAGRGVVAYDNPGSREVVEDWGGNWPLGRMVPIGHITAAADAIQDLAQRMRTAAPPTVPSFPQPADIIGDYDDLLRDLVVTTAHRDELLVDG
jgi:glycosyltransferase involved in cell wall biosynthesis